MLYSLLLIAVLLVLFTLNKKWQRLPKAQRAKQFRQVGLWLCIAAVIVLVIMGRAHWLMGVLAGLVAVLGRLAAVAQYIPLFRNILRGSRTQNSQKTHDVVVQSDMTVKQAAAILAVEPNATKDDIVLAHKKLMQKLHPDRGGSDALAAQINQAKQVMLAELT